MLVMLLIFLSMAIAEFHLNIKNITGKTKDNGAKSVDISVPQKCLNNKKCH